MKRYSKILIASTLLSLAATPALYAANIAEATPTTTQSQPANSYLGVTIAPVPRALRAQLGALIPADQGILVRQVIPGSPAEKAGMQPFDILLTFDDQKLYATEQLVKLVRGSSNGSEIVIKLVRNGNVTPVKVVIAGQPEATTPELQQQPWPLQQQNHGRHHRLNPRTMQPLPSNARNWESFAAISMEKMEDGRYKTSIEYLTKEGSKKKLEFEGTRAQIRDQILRQDDLPEIERNQLLDLLTGRDDLFMPSFPVPRGFILPRMFDWNPGF